ncbi:pyridoxal phosphate-dependent transferase [Coniochaeta sp. 2T2.1]|nr:pyridoxal phosphate-dependent transferase [Coniochaeta sp. 2T2.1]
MCLTTATPPHRRFHTKNKDASEALGTAAKLPDAEPIPPRHARHSTSLSDILDRRAKAGKLVAGTAAYSDSDMFKAPSIGKPKAKRWDHHHLTQESLLRQPCVLKQAAKHLKKPGLISLGGGLPCAENFPFESISMKVPSVDHFSEAETLASGDTVSMGKYDVSAQKDLPHGGGAEYDLSIALNYGQATGSAQMMRWVTEHTELVCDPPYANWRSCLTVGSTGALEQALRMFLDKERGDCMLTEEYSFSTALETVAPLGCKVFGIKMDEQGLLPGSMDEILSNWDAGARGARKPHLLYTVPSGQNPTGATMGERRRREVMDVCRKHDVFVIEDEPYYFLQMQPYTGAGKAGVPPPRNVEEFLEGLIPSLLSLDVDGRVLRMDSFSKVVVPGSRLGWVTGSEQIIERYIRHSEVCNEGPSGFSQAILFKLLDEQWGHEGYLKWLMNLRLEYTRRRDALMAACEKNLPRDVVSWTPPAAGMFHWLKVDHTRHPDASKRSILEIEEEIFNACIEKGVLVGRGSWFRAEHGTVPTDMFFRATYASATPENMMEAIRRFGEAVRESFGIE